MPQRKKTSFRVAKHSLRKKPAKLKQKKLSVLNIFKESFSLLKKEPKLFFPKMVVAILYGIVIYFEAQIFLEVLSLSSGTITVGIISRLNELLVIMLVLFIYNIFLYLIDIFVNSLYPTLVEQLEKGKKVSLTIAVKDSKKHFGTIFASTTIPLIVLLIITLPFSLLAAIYRDYSIMIHFFVMVVLGYLFIMLFYLLYPVVVLGKKSTSSSLTETIRLSLANKKEVFYLSIVPFSVTILKTGAAFLAEDPAFFIAFVLLVLLTGIVYTYHMVINPHLYLKVK